MWESNVYLAPVRWLGFGFGQAGLYDADGRLIPSAPLFATKDSRWNLPRRRLTRPADADRLTGPVIYGGMFYPGFCHFLTETLPNLIALGPARAANPEARIVMHAEARTSVKRTAERPYARFFLDLLGIEAADIVLVQRPVIATDIALPPPAFSAQLRPAPHLPALIDAAFAGVAATGPEKVYFSRLNWDRKGPRVPGEARVQAQFEAAGYTAVHMQDLSLADQLALARAATRVAGPQGTAVHWSLFSPATRGVISLGWRSRLQEGICAARGQVYRNPRGLMTDPRYPRARRIGAAAIARALAAMP